MNIKGKTFVILLNLLCFSPISLIAQNPGNKFYNRGIEHFDYAHYDSAIYYMRQAEMDFLTKMDTTGWLKTRIVLAEVYHEIAQYDSCSMIIENIEIQIKKLPDDIVLHFLLYSYYVNHHCVFANIAKADEYLTQMDKLAPIIKNDSLKLKYFFNNYQVFFLKGDYNKAMQYIDSAIAGTDSKLLLAKYFVTKQLIAYRLTNYGEQATYLQRCGDLIKELNIPYHWINAKLNEGYGYWNMEADNFDLCLEFNKKSYNISRKLYQDYHPEIAIAFNQLGISYSQNDDSSIYCHRQALKIRQKLFGEDNFICSYSYNNLGNMLKKRKEFDSSAWYYAKAVQIRQKELGLHHPKMANSYLKLEELYRELKDYKKALRYAHLALCSSIHTFNDTANFMENPVVGNYYSRETFQAMQLKEILLFLISLEESNKTGQIDILKKSFECSCKLDTIVTNGFKNGITYDENSFKINYESRFSSFSIIFRLYWLTGDQFYLNEGLKIIDSSKSSLLYNQLNINSSNISPEILGYMENKEHKFSIIKQMINKNLSATEKDSLKQLIKKLEDILIKQENQLRQDQPECYFLLKGRDDLNIKHIQKILPKNTAILYYVLSNGSIIKLLISNDTIAPWGDTFSESAKGKIKAYRTMIEKKMDLDTSFFKLGHELHQIFIHNDTDSILQARGIKNLIVISDAEAWTIPFEALITKEIKVKPNQIRELPFLIKKYNISYAPSLYFAYHSLCQKQEKKFKKDILLVAPVFKSNQLAYASSSTRTYIENLEKDNPENVSGENSVLRDNGISALPYTEIEVNGIDKQFQEKHRNTEILLNENARYSKVLQNLNNPYRIVHFATHGITNMGFPDLSGIILASDSVGNENILFAGDLANTSLSCDLAVLSACETAYGKVVSGDGIYNLAQSFAALDVPNVIATLWKVADQSTSELMVNFYKDLLQNKFASYSESLYRAKLKMIKEETYTHPFYWAPFVLSRY